MPLVKLTESPKVASITGLHFNFSRGLQRFFFFFLSCLRANITFSQASPCCPGLQGNNKEKGVGSQHLPVLMLNTCQEMQWEEVNKGGSQGRAGTPCKEELRRLWIHRLALLFNPACVCARACAVSWGLQIITQEGPHWRKKVVLIVTTRAKYGQTGTTAKTLSLVSQNILRYLEKSLCQVICMFISFHYNHFFSFLRVWMWQQAVKYTKARRDENMLVIYY